MIEKVFIDHGAIGEIEYSLERFGAKSFLYDATNKKDVNYLSMLAEKVYKYFRCLGMSCNQIKFLDIADDEEQLDCWRMFELSESVRKRSF